MFLTAIFKMIFKTILVTFMQFCIPVVSDFHHAASKIQERFGDNPNPRKTTNFILRKFYFYMRHKTSSGIAENHHNFQSTSGGRSLIQKFERNLNSKVAFNKSPGFHELFRNLHFYSNNLESPFTMSISESLQVSLDKYLMKN